MMIMMMVIALFAHRRDFANIPLAYDAHRLLTVPDCLTIALMFNSNVLQIQTHGFISLS